MNGGITITNPVLHCEVEGAGVADYQNWLRLVSGSLSPRC